jgi:hypothetical protein
LPATWEAGLRQFVTMHQRMARLKRQWFVPTNRALGTMRALVIYVGVRARRQVTETHLLPAAAPAPDRA